jgi:uncharacterized integral membrane protein
MNNEVISNERISNVVYNEINDIEYIKKEEYKEKLLEHINEQIIYLRDKLQLVSLKYDDIRKMFNNFSIIILVLSSLLTLIDAFTLLISQYLEKKTENTEDMLLIINIVSLFFGTLMTIFTSIIRFKNYRENMEKLKEIQEKLIQLKAHYAKEEGILKLMKGNDDETFAIIQERLEEYNEKLNEINIISFVSNSQLLKYEKYISKFKLQFQEIKKNELEKINNINK